MQSLRNQSPLNPDKSRRDISFGKTVRIMPGLLLLFLWTASLSACLALTQPEPLERQPALFGDDSVDSQAAVSIYELQAAVMSAADSYAGTMANAFTSFANAVGSEQARLHAAMRKAFGTIAAVEIAAGPYPGGALLDLVVLITLNRMVWEDHWSRVYGRAAEPVLVAFRDQEREIWNLAGRYLTSEQRNDLRELLLAWRAENPKATGVNYIRFSDFGGLGLKPTMRELAKPGGVFATMREATAIAGDIKVTLDRAMYLFSRLQLVANFQFEFAILQAVTTPEIRSLLKGAENFQKLGKQYAGILEQFPREMDGIVQGTLDNALQQIGQERKNTIVQALTGLTDLQAQTLTKISEMIREERSQAIAQALQGIESRQREMTEEAQMLVLETGDELRKTINHAALLVLGLLICFFALLFVYKAATRRKS